MHNRRCTKCRYDESPTVGTMFEKLGKTVTLDDIQITMEKYYRILLAGEGEDYENESSELMIMNIDKAKAFRESLCFNCGKNITEIRSYSYFFAPKV